MSRRALKVAGWGKWFALLVLALGGVIDSAWSHALAAGGILGNKLDSIKTATRAGEWETYLTGHAWHLPNGYGETTRARLNETNWGGGIGRTYNDDDGDRHSVYFMAFADSHRAPQFNLGYGWQRYWNATGGVSLGAGYLAFLFSREDVANHLPVPALLPCASIRVRNIELIGLFVPRISRDIKGDVVFLYLRVPLGGTGRIHKP
jgi:palmitoyl transferase